MAGKHSDHYFCRWQAKIVITINFFFEKNEKCLELPDLSRPGSEDPQRRERNLLFIFELSAFVIDLKLDLI